MELSNALRFVLSSVLCDHVTRPYPSDLFSLVWSLIIGSPSRHCCSHLVSIKPPSAPPRRQPWVGVAKSHYISMCRDSTNFIWRSNAVCIVVVLIYKRYQKLTHTFFDHFYISAASEFVQVSPVVETGQSSKEIEVDTSSFWTLPSPNPCTDFHKSYVKMCILRC